MYEPSDRDWDTLTQWEPHGDLDHDVRERDALTAAGLDLFGGWLGDRHRDLAHLLAFCREWHGRWRESGESADRDRWFDEFRSGGPRSAAFPITVGPRSDATGTVTDDAGSGLSRAGVERLAPDYVEFAPQVKAWRDQLRGQGWVLPGDVLDAAPPAPGELGGAWAGVPVQMDVFSEQAQRRRIAYRTAEEFRAAFEAAGLGSWFDAEQAFGAAAGGASPAFTSPMADVNMAYERELNCFIVMIPIRTGGLADSNSAALRSLVEDQSRCFYLQFEDCVALSTTGSFTRADPIGLTLLRIAAGAPRSGIGRFEVPSASNEMGQIVRRNRRGPNRDYFTVHPGDHSGADSDYETIRALIKAAHPHRHVERA